MRILQTMLRAGDVQRSINFYTRVMRSSPAYQSGSKDYSSLPPSIASAMQKTAGAYLPTYQSRLFDKETRLPDGVVSGSRTITLEIEK